MKKKKREYLSSELVRSFAKAYGLEEKMEGLKIKAFLEDYLDTDLYQEITQVLLDKKVLTLRIQSPLLKNDFRLRKSFYLNKFRNVIGEDKILDLKII